MEVKLLSKAISNMALCSSASAAFWCVETQFEPVCNVIKVTHKSQCEGIIIQMLFWSYSEQLDTKMKPETLRDSTAIQGWNTEHFLISGQKIIIIIISLSLYLWTVDRVSKVISQASSCFASTVFSLDN